MSLLQHPWSILYFYGIAPHKTHGDARPFINPRRACAARVVSVKSHLTYGASVRPENAVTYSAGNEGQKFCGVSRPFSMRISTRMRVSRVYTRMIHRRGFSTLINPRRACAARVTVVGSVYVK